jgi:ribosomal protein S18 acetylase RimI-like enzyme
MTSGGNSELLIRELKLWEIPALLRFRAEHDYNAPFESRETNTESVIRSILKMFWHGERMVTFVAYKGDDLVGYLSLVFGKGNKFKGNCHLVSTAVSPAERGKGIGTQLFDIAEKCASTRGARRIELEVFATNTGAIRLYERLGYEVEGRKKRAVETAEGSDDLILMAKFLRS